LRKPSEIAIRAGSHPNLVGEKCPFLPCGSHTDRHLELIRQPSKPAEALKRFARSQYLPSHRPVEASLWDSARSPARIFTCVRWAPSRLDEVPTTNQVICRGLLPHDSISPSPRGLSRTWTGKTSDTSSARRHLGKQSLGKRCSSTSALGSRYLRGASSLASQVFWAICRTVGRLRRVAIASGSSLRIRWIRFCVMARAAVAKVLTRPLNGYSDTSPDWREPTFGNAFVCSKGPCESTLTVARYGIRRTTRRCVRDMKRAGKASKGQYVSF
jgi:hypothetical protein